MVAKLLAVLFLYAAGIALGVGIMVYGWGLEPKSWLWIIGGGVVGRFIVASFEHVVKEEGKK